MDWFTRITNGSLRDIVLALAVILTLYIVYLLVELMRKNHERTLSNNSKRDQNPPLGLASGNDEAANAPPFAVSSNMLSFAEAKQQRAIRREIEDLRNELVKLSGEVDQLKQSMNDQLGRVRLAQNTSHHYSEAMSLAMHGNNAKEIADKCHISRAEAELVVSLSKSKA